MTLYVVVFSKDHGTVNLELCTYIQNTPLKMMSSPYCTVSRQSSQVDLLAKSEICDGVDVDCDAACVTPLKWSRSILPEKILKNGSS